MSDFYHLAITFLKDGGIFIIPIGIVLFIGLSIGFERWLFLTLEKLRNKKALEQFVPILNSGKKQQMSAYASENKASVTRIISCGLHMMTATNDREEIENALSEGMLDVVIKLKQRISYTAMLANVATLLGLLGTIIGLIGAFSAVASADSAEKSRILSESISIAMNTTAFGIIVAIPLLIIHALLTNQSQKITNEIETASVKFLNIMTRLRLIETRSASANSTTPITPHATRSPQVDTHKINTKKTEPQQEILIENQLSLDDDPEIPTTSIEDHLIEDHLIEEPLADTTPITPLAEAPTETEFVTPVSTSQETHLEEIQPITPAEPEPEPTISVETPPVATKKEKIPATEPAPTKTKADSTSSFVASPYLAKLLKSQAMDKTKTTQSSKQSTTEPDIAKSQPIATPKKPEITEPETIEPQETEILDTNTPESAENTKPKKEENTGKAVFSFSEPTSISLEEELRLLELKKAEEQKKMEDKE